MRFVHCGHVTSRVASAGKASYPNPSAKANRSMDVPDTRLAMHFLTRSVPAVAC